MIGLKLNQKSIEAEKIYYTYYKNNNLEPSAKRRNIQVKNNLNKIKTPRSL